MNTCGSVVPIVFQHALHDELEDFSDRRDRLHWRGSSYPLSRTSSGAYIRLHHPRPLFRKGLVIQSHFRQKTQPESRCRILQRSKSTQGTVLQCRCRVRMRQLAETAFKLNLHLTIAQADADDLAAAKAILSGMKDKFSITGVAPTLIHTVSRYN